MAQIVVLDDDHEIDLDEALTKLRAPSSLKSPKRRQTRETNHRPSDSGNAGVGYNEDADRDVRPTKKRQYRESSCTLRFSRSQPG